jgi:hypothetical protein
MRIMPDGNIGIGATAPAALLQVGAGTPNAFDATKTTNFFVKGDIELDGTIYGNGSGLTGLPAGGAAGSTTQVQYNNAGTLAGALGFVWDGTNVGIGITGPTQKLAVDGSIYIPATMGNMGIGTALPPARLPGPRP